MNNLKRRFLSVLLCLCMLVSFVPAYAFAVESVSEVPEQLALTTEETAQETAEIKEEAAAINDVVSHAAQDSVLYDTSVSKGYFKVVEQKVYDLAPGAQEYGFTLNNAEGNDRKLVHVFAVDTMNEDIDVMPGYWGIDKLDPNNLALDGILDKSEYWKAMEVTKTVKYYENMGYNVVGAMNTALAYDTNAPYGYMVWNGVVLGTPQVHKGAKTYLAIDWDGTCELRSMSTPLTGNEKTAVSANFEWLVKDGKLVTTQVERTSSDASRSMLGIKADGTLIICHVDGRQGNTVSGGLSNYEMGEMMLALGCVNAVNGDGGGSSTFVSKRSTDTENIMRSMPSDGAERPTINSIILVSKAGASGIFDKVVFESEYEYVAPGASMPVDTIGQDTKLFDMDIPAEVTYQVAEAGMGTIEDGIYTAGSTTGTATIQAVYNGNVVGELKLNVVHPKTFKFASDSTVIPYGRSIDIVVDTTYGDDNWAVCIDGACSVALSNPLAATVEGNKLTATKDETITGVDVVVTYIPDPTKTATLNVEFGKGSEIVFDFESGDHAHFLGVDEMFAWAKETGASAPIQTNGNYSKETDSVVFLADQSNGQVRNGDHALGVTLDYTEAEFASWSYNMFFHTITDADTRILRDVANGKNATTFGMWVYIPEGGAGLAMQLQGFKNPDGTGPTGAHFYFTTASGAVKNLNSCTEEDIPASRWVYATCDLTKFGDFFSLYDPFGVNGREPSFIRFYVKPTKAANLTFYFDDFTLDYSKAVDDRLAPTIKNIEYAAGDVSASVEGESVSISASSAAFSAVVTENGNAGLNTKSAQIFLDGNPVDTLVSGNKIVTASDVPLSNGKHVVTFEIADNLGNSAQKSAEFTVKASAQKEIVYLTGHNDSGKMPEYDSVYYVDLKTTDAAAVSSVVARIQLNTANEWELEHMTVAPGYEVDYIRLDEEREIVTYGVNRDIHSVENVVEITLTRTDDCTLSGEQTLVSIPVRLWSWNGINHVTGKPITPEEQYKTGYCPVVNVTCNVLAGYVETANGDVTFGGGIDVATKINDTVYPWHYHDKVLTIMTQDATCDTDGYENRTYCETCMSVVDWGTKIEAKGHEYVVNADGQFVCACGDVLNTQGLVKLDDKIYYMIDGRAVSGWQNAGGKWCYADADTKEVQTGEFNVGGITYTADENGLLVSGVWVEDFIGRRYNYGPAFYDRCFVTIDGAEYYFAEKTGYALTGYHMISDNRNNPNAAVRWYHFAEDGKLIERMTMTGVLDTGNGLYYMEDGCTKFAGMIKVGDDYYCVADKTGLVLTGHQWVGTYIMERSVNPMEVGYYEFGADGKLLQGVVAQEDGTYYYEMGKPVAAGWVKDGDDYYVFGDGGRAVVGRHWIGSYLTQHSKDPYKSGNFIFAKDGKLANGVVEYDGAWHYYVDGIGEQEGLVCIDGNYYLAETNGKLATGRVWIGTYASNGLIPAGHYEFGEDGMMLNGIVEKEDGIYYYEQGRPVDTGWLKVGEDYYVFTNGGRALSGYYWIGSYMTQKSRDPYKQGNFFFTEEGKLADGVVLYNDEWYYYEMGVAEDAGLVCINGNYYLAETDGKLATGRVWVGTYASNGLLPAGHYTFDNEGKMMQGVVEVEDGLYYYDLGNIVEQGLLEHNGEFYYVNEGGKLATGRIWVGSYASNGLVAAGYYEFGTDGAMLNGIETVDGVLYYYHMGAAQRHGLKVIGTDLYFITDGGKVVTGRVWVGTYDANGLLPAGYYTFDAEGKLIK